MAEVNSIEFVPSASQAGAQVHRAGEQTENSALLAVIDLEDGFIEMGSMFEAFDAVAGDQPPAWLHVMWSGFRRLEAAMDRVSLLVRAPLDDAQ